MEIDAFVSGDVGSFAKRLLGGFDACAEEDRQCDKNESQRAADGQLKGIQDAPSEICLPPGRVAASGQIILSHRA